MPTINRFSLNKPGAYDTINTIAGVMKPLENGVTYTAKPDTVSCSNTVLPADTTCYPGNQKAIYQQLQVGENGILSINASTTYSRFYKGDANALAITQNAFSFPKRINNLQSYSECISYSCGGSKVCVVPGTYTYVSFTNESQLSAVVQPSFSFSNQTTKFASLATAENLGTITGTKYSELDIFGCRDNVVAITGADICRIGGKETTKAIYRQFYLEKDSRLSISGYHATACGYGNTGVMSLFYGKATDGAGALKPVGGMYSCFQSVNASQCDVMPAGWYTLISYGTGPSYDEPKRDLQQWGYSSFVGYTNQAIITAEDGCTAPKYNRPSKAAIDTITKQPFLIQWAPRVGHSVAYPKTDTVYTLYKENFNCTVDTPFINHPVLACTAEPKVAYYVFRTTQVCYLRINTDRFWSALFKGNARAAGVKFDSASLVHPCSPTIQILNLQPGDYTLAVFGTASDNCVSFEPLIYIDQMAYSRFDHAVKAYDFGTILPDSAWHNGKVGDVNPLNKDRAPSNDFFYSTTGSQISDPTESTCYVDHIPGIYHPKNNNALYPAHGSFHYVPRRNLWYTFVAKEGGTVKVRVNNKTIGKTAPYRFAVYKSNADGRLSFPETVGKGAVDSTVAQGLALVANNQGYWYYCYGTSQEVSFYREPCSPVPERYYIVVDNVNYNPGAFAMDPNSQVEVEVLLDSIHPGKPKFDHYANASNIGTNLGSGNYKGETDTYSCATRTATDPVIDYYCTTQKTLWYKFSTKVSGYIRYRLQVNGNPEQYNEYNMELFQEVKPGDSTSAGLKFIYPSRYLDPYMYWGETCITPGTYYIIVTGCDRIDQTVFPELVIVEQAGDYCSAPVTATLPGEGSRTVSAIVNCHTIGTDYGEFNPTLTCPNGALKGEYKTTWYRVDITGKDTLDVTTYLTENTTASPSEIKYRLMEGSCGAMQERSCVQDAQTRDTYKCLPPGSYYIQVFTPLTKFGQPVTGDITLNLSAVQHVDTCAPLKTCLSTAVFLPQFDCTKSEEVTFTNLSTYGTNIQYQWDFGWNGQTSTAVSPAIVYPALEVDKTYTIKLKVTNNNCPAGSENVDETSAQLTIPARPKFGLGGDTTLCTAGASLKLNAETWKGTTYQWSTGETTPAITFSSAGYPYTIWVEANYKGCIKRDTVMVAINPHTKQKLTSSLCREDSVLLNAIRGPGVSYLWNTGGTDYYVYAKNAGLYTANVDWRGCIIRDTFEVIKAPQPFPREDTTVCPPFRSFTLNIASPNASSYYWQNGASGPEFRVDAPGTYWAQAQYATCYYRDTIVVKEAPPALTMAKDTTLCEGQSYVAPWGQMLDKSGIYRNTVKFISGCDSLVQTVNLRVITTTKSDLTTSICNGSSYTLPWGLIVSNAGTYRDTLRSRAGCDSLIRTVILQVNKPTVNSTSFTICQGQTYTLPWGRQVSATGVYTDTLRHRAGCDSVIRMVDLRVKPVLTRASSVNICEGAGYTLPWGPSVSADGTYRNIITYSSGCDSLVQEVTVTVKKKSVQNLVASVCEGKSYVLPWGATVNTAGIFRDTVRTAEGCDSLVRSVDLAIARVSRSAETIRLCEGSAVTLPSGLLVRTGGSFVDTLRSVNGGCDSVIRTINVVLQTATTTRITPTICAGTNYTLPWGLSVGEAGTYRDTLRYSTGCDSVIRVVELKANTPQSANMKAAICAGETYTLPWGQVVSQSGIYTDTLRYQNGCDSLRRRVELDVRTVSRSTAAATICSGDSYLLPWGIRATAAGTYSDTLRYKAGCDSIIRVLHLLVQAPTVQALNVAICAGQSYTLPNGQLVNAGGIYSDTLFYASGCDSLIRRVNLAVNSVTSLSQTITLCQGQSYVLPWGTTVSTEGTFRDTLRYLGGCDSVRRLYTVAFRTAATLQSQPIICEGDAYTLPWGRNVTTAGIYRDTLRYAAGCDSVIRVVDLSVRALTLRNTTATICKGSNYILPWGSVVNVSGVYRDTLRYQSGCDSLRRTVTLVVQEPRLAATTATICSGQVYTLPSGFTVSASGTYRDTLRYDTGCDSLIRSVSLVVQQSRTEATSAIVCEGQPYLLPWGQSVTAGGIYRDTLRYKTGCDSLIRSVELMVQRVTTQASSPSICQGRNYLLPWGTVAATTGVYRDTLRYVTGCDSVIRVVNLRVTAPAQTNIATSICADEWYSLPWGQRVNQSGIYRDTVRTNFGCDSLIRSVDLRVRRTPILTVAKSNDVDCMLGTAKLSVTGASTYTWSPAASLSQAASATPVAAPTATTVYSVTGVSAEGCSAQASIEVKVSGGDAANGYLVPDAFTPNGDGRNDCFGVRHWGTVQNFRMTIYNRWGEIVFVTTEPFTCWDGTNKGKVEGSATFVYVITADTQCGKVLRKGFVNLIR